MNFKKHQILIWVSVFAVTMGIFEGSVVVYLRALYYPEGFNFPLAPIDNQIAITELIRELASLFMLLSVGIVAGKNFSQRFAWFIYSFAIWDIIYYVFLYLILGWPESLLTWDILFLLPIIWTGPVIAPVLLSILMIILAMIIYHFNFKYNYKVKILRKEWLALILGSITVFISFIWDFCRFIIRNISLSEIKNLTFKDKLFNLSVKYIPESFNWIIYVAGVIIIIVGIVNLYKRLLNFKKH
ncbi:MAG: hypothetical protein PF485_09385 [Bacteroidales bacterium]|jgi:hypothetical protein|nr:hypothetical protein [Bacteroidales bacterium]